MIIINNPNNPTGSVIPAALLCDIVNFCESRDIILLSDEVYRPLFHDGCEGPHSSPPATSFIYEKVIVTGSMSKAFALAGIRIGWLASRDKMIIETLAAARDYMTISVSQLDDQIASYALSPGVRFRLLQRNISLAVHNLSLVQAFVEEHLDICSWTRPVAGTTAFIQFRSGGVPVDDVNFCRDLLRKTKVLFCPGSLCFGSGHDFCGFVRIGYVCNTEVLEAALSALRNYVRLNFTR